MVEEEVACRPVCRGGCHNGGTCVSPDNCRCPKGFAGPNCYLKECDKESHQGNNTLLDYK